MKMRTVLLLLGGVCLLGHAAVNKNVKEERRGRAAGRGLSDTMRAASASQQYTCAQILAMDSGPSSTTVGSTAGTTTWGTTDTSTWGTTDASYSPPAAARADILDDVTGTTGAPCVLTNLDLVFVLDESGSIGEDNFQIGLAGIANFVLSGLTVGQGDGYVHVGFVEFDEYGYVQFGFDSNRNSIQVAQAICSLPYSSGSTNIANGMNTAIYQVFNASTPNRSKKMLVITDGQDNSDVRTAAITANNLGITIFAMGIGDDVDLQELYTITGSPDRVFALGNWSQLQTVWDDNCGTIQNSTGFATIPTDQTWAVQTTTTTEFQRTTTTLPPPHVDTQCACTPTKLWLDIVFLIDISAGIDLPGFSGTKGTIISFIGQLQISQAAGANSRVSYIAVGRNATVYGDLGAYTSLDGAINGLLAIPYEGLPQFDLAAGLVAAQDVLKGARKNAKRMIVVFSSATVDCNNKSVKDKMKIDVTDVCTVAATIVQDATTNEIVTVAMRLGEEDQYPILNLYNPCHQYTSDQSLPDLLARAGCDVNCFCSDRGTTLFTSNCVRYASCVYATTSPAAYGAAALTCNLTSIHSSAKDNFVISTLTSGNHLPYYIGARGQPPYYLTWADGALLQPNDYTNWDTRNNEPVNRGGDTVVFANRTSAFAVQWKTVAYSLTSPAYYAACEKRACDTDNYCA